MCTSLPDHIYTEQQRAEPLGSRALGSNSNVEMGLL